jgi:hypothetical protein
MKRVFLMAAVLAGAAAAGTGWVSAQTPAPAPAPKTAPHADHGRGVGPAPGMMGGGMGMMGGGIGMMGGGMGPGMGMMGGGMCHMGMGSADTKIDVKNVDKGVTITITSTDPAKVTRLQKMAQAMRLMHEASAP